jgi:large subunit ribosomal protein L1
MFRGKNYKAAKEGYDSTKCYGLMEAVDIVKKVKYAKFDETVEITVNLGVNPKHADQMVRGVVTLPHGTGKDVKVLVIASGDAIGAAQDAGADYVGGKEIVEKIKSEGWLEFDKVVATPDMMRFVGQIGKILGPRGLMPNPKLGTVTKDVGPVVKSLKAGQIEYRVDRYGIIHMPSGKVSFDNQKIFENILVILNALNKAKPASAKGVYMQNVVVSSTMGPGVKVDTATISTDIEEGKRNKLFS